MSASASSAPAAIQRALISVSDKTGIAEFAKSLAGMNVELISTGGTSKALRDAGLKVKDISELTGFPEIMDGRVKTLHPKVHGGLLYRRDLPAHLAQAKEHGILPIDLVVVNLYPFEQTIAKGGVTPEEAIEQIDIGGPSMIRSAAKNWESVTVITDPSDYTAVLRELRAMGNTTRPTRLRLASKVFALTSRYDGAICAYLESLGEGDAPQTVSVSGALKQALRYGENPHQKGAAIYALPGFNEPSVAGGKQVWGKEVGFNNVLDLNTAFEIVKEFSTPAVSVVKHNNPCGVATSDTLINAYLEAYAGDPLSAFGGVLGMNRPLTLDIAEAILGASGFKVDAIVAPSITPDALQALTTKKKWGANVIVIEAGSLEKFKRSNNGGAHSAQYRDIRTIPGGILVQSPDVSLWEEEFANLKTVTKRAPTAAELDALKFSWIVCKHVKSNAIVLAKGCSVVGVGAGQMSRVDSVEIAIKKAGDRAKDTVLASDAFFPFPDGPEAAARAGVTAIIQPGGSVKDKEVIETCDRFNVAMVMTGVRHFRH